MQVFSLFLFLAILSPFCAAKPAPEVEITMSVLQRSQESYEAFLKEQHKTVFEVSSLKSKYANRNVVAMVTIMQALKLGGISPILVMVTAPNYAREIQMVKSGAVTLVHQDAWDVDFDDSVYMSQDFIPNGRFVKGIYVKASDKDRIKITGISDFKNYSAVSSPQWTVDWQTLSRLNLKKLHTTQDKIHMLNVVLVRDVDFTVQEFNQTQDMAYETEHGRLIPLAGIKLALSGTRSFMVSKRHKDGEKIFAALQKGLAVMRKNGTIDRYLTEAGFYDAATRNWKTLDVDKAQ